jgi:hypothetical protein
MRRIIGQFLPVEYSSMQAFLLIPLKSYAAANTLYIHGMVFFDKIRTLRYNGEGESVFHLMPLSMVRRLDPLLNALLRNSYGIGNLLREGRVCMCKVDSSKACIGNDFY